MSTTLHENNLVNFATVFYEMYTFKSKTNRAVVNKFKRQLCLIRQEGYWKCDCVVQKK